MAAVRKWEMLEATRVKVSSGSRKKSEQDQIQHFLHKTCNEECNEDVSGSFTLSSCKTTAKKCNI